VNLKKNLSTILSPGELKKLVLSFDVVGDIAIIIVPADLSHQETAIAGAILETNRNIRVVAKRDSHYQTINRTIKLKIIGGENRKETVHKEFGIQLKLNAEEVYFSVRSSTERRRVASLVEPGEHVLVLFSGIAPYPLHIARFSAAASITAIERNPAAHRYAEMNLALNKAADKIDLYHGDAVTICPRLGRTFHRVVMPLPKAGFTYVPTALKSLKENGRLHFYTIQKTDTVPETVNSLEHICNEHGRRIIDYRVAVCGHTGPKHYRYCIDAFIR